MIEWTCQVPFLPLSPHSTPLRPSSTPSATHTQAERLRESITIKRNFLDSGHRESTDFTKQLPKPLLPWFFVVKSTTNSLLLHFTDVAFCTNQREDLLSAKRAFLLYCNPLRRSGPEPTIQACLQLKEDEEKPGGHTQVPDWPTGIKRRRNRHCARPAMEMTLPNTWWALSI